MTLEEDRIIGDFLKDLAKEVPGGLNDVFVVLTGDHGIPPTLNSFEFQPCGRTPQVDYLLLSLRR